MSIYARINSYTSVPLLKFILPTALLVDAGVNASFATYSFMQRISSAGSILPSIGLLAATFGQAYAGLYLMDQLAPYIEKKKLPLLFSPIGGVCLSYIPVYLAVKVGMDHILPQGTPLLGRVVMGMAARTCAVTIVATALVMTIVLSAKWRYERTRRLQD
jgi:hypothetical protein